MFDYTDIYNNTFGKLKVLELHNKEQKYNIKGKKDGYKYFYLCECDCGKKCVVERNQLRFNQVNSCGCLKAIAKTTHNQYNTRLYRIWSNMKNRCINTKVKCYKRYGGRGIKVCDEWLKFKPFYQWAINNGYQDNLSIDRIDVNGNYEPSNCRWITLFAQANNKRNNHFITHNNETHTLAEWSRITNIKARTLSKRITNYGWSIEKALTTKVKNGTK